MTTDLGNWTKPTPDPLACYDCGLRYGGPGWMDSHVPNDVWARISPTGHEGGILCVTCMARRCEALGLEDVPFQVTSGPFSQWSEVLVWIDHATALEAQIGDALEHEGYRVDSPPPPEGSTARLLWDALRVNGKIIGYVALGTEAVSPKGFERKARREPTANGAPTSSRPPERRASMTETDRSYFEIREENDSLKRGQARLLSRLQEVEAREKGLREALIVVLAKCNAGAQEALEPRFADDDPRAGIMRRVAAILTLDIGEIARKALDALGGAAGASEARLGGEPDGEAGTPT